MQVYDVAIVGAGIAGCTLAFFCKEKNTILLDKAALPATGGSGAAGAFISPKLGKKSPLLELTNKAFEFAVNFYNKNFPNYFDNSGVLRLPKDSNDAKNFLLYQEISGGELLKSRDLKKYNINDEVGLFFKDGGVCDAKALCKSLIKDINFLQFELKKLQYENGVWKLIGNEREFLAKNVILATGYEGFEGLEYMGIRGVWGSRGDFYCKKDINICVHKSVSISAKEEGVVKIGATHLRVKSPIQACQICNGAPLEELVQKVKVFFPFEEIKLKEIFCGMRSASRDYFPLVGRVIDSDYMLNTYPQIKKGFSKAPIKYKQNLYVFNGLGGRGFVFAPLLAKWLKELIFENKQIPKEVNPDRLFLKWARKLC